MTPTIQRLAVFACLEKTKKHPTADQILTSVRKEFPTVSRATVYNTLEVLTRAGLILQITIEPSVARYDADLNPHAHFRCRLCNKVYDIRMDREFDLDEYVDGHHVEAVRAYAYGVCSECLEKDPSQGNLEGVSKKPTSALCDAPADTTQRKTKSFSNEPTKEVRDARAS